MSSTSPVDAGDAEELGALIGDDERRSDAKEKLNVGHAQRVGVAGISSSVFNLANTILGSGTLSMPFACLVCGMGVFGLLMATAALMAHYSIVILMKTVDHLGVSESEHLGYPLLGLKAYGHRGKLMASWSVTLQQIGACIGYIVIIGDVFSPVLGDLMQSQLICDRWPLQLGIIVCIIFPLCMLRTMDSLKYTSLAALMFVIMFAFVVFGNGVYVVANPEEREVLYDALTSATQFCEEPSTSGGGKITPLGPPFASFPPTSDSSAPFPSCHSRSSATKIRFPSTKSSAIAPSQR